MTDEPLRLRCACGWETTGSEDELVEATQEHGRRMHNMLPTREQVLAMVVEPEGTRADAAADGPPPDDRPARPGGAVVDP